MLVYLAGAFCKYQTRKKSYNDWRDFVIGEVNNKKITFFDPRKHSNQLCPATFTMGDAEGVLISEILLNYRTKGYENEGASWEQGIAFATNLINQKVQSGFPEKLILSVDETEAPWPLNFASANVNFSNLERAAEFLSKIKSIEKESWMPLYMEFVDRDRGCV